LDGRIVTRTLAVRPGLPYAASDHSPPSRRPLSSYRARAPPAA
jgi:hypothetical protein